MGKEAKPRNWIEAYAAAIEDGSVIVGDRKSTRLNSSHGS